jgi:hypothetical protein
MSTTYYASSFIFATIPLLPPLFYIGICEMCTIICYSKEVRMMVMMMRRKRKRMTMTTESQ